MINITLAEGSQVITDEEKFSDTFKTNFSSVVKELKITEDLFEKVINIEDPILAATEKYKRHPNIFKIKEKAKIQN